MRDKTDEVVHVYKSNTGEAEARGSLKVLGQPGLHSETKASLNYTARPYLKPNQTKNGRALLCVIQSQSFHIDYSSGF